MTEPQHDDVLDLRDYLAVLRRRWVVIAVVIAVTLAAALAVTLTQTPLYEAETRLVVEAAGSDEQILRNLVLGERELETQRELATSVPVAQRVIENLGLDTTPSEVLEQINAEAIRNTEILTIRATDESAATAAALADAFAASYLEYRRDQALDRALSAGESLDARSAGLRDRISEIDRQLRTASDSDASALEEERNALLVQLGQVSAQRSAIGSGESFITGGGEIIQPAEVPDSPVSPKPLRTGVLALVLGAMLGVGLAFLRDYLDDAIRSDDQAVRASGRPVLGHIPKVEDRAGSDRAISLTDPTAPAAEAYRTLRTNLKFLSVSEPLRSLMVTSAQQGEGKTTTAANLAVSAARAGDRVILVGADLRKPTVHKLFGMGQLTGLSELLAGEVELSAAIRDIGITNLRVIPTGRIPPNPAELLASARMEALFEQLTSMSDLVVVDAPPLLGLADSLELAARVSGVLLVVDAGESGRHAVHTASQRLSGVGARLAGTLMNRVESSRDGYGYYYTAYGYIEDPDANGKGRRRQGRGRSGRARDADEVTSRSG